jgi:hypothetical protein
VKGLTRFAITCSHCSGHGVVLLPTVDAGTGLLNSRPAIVIRFMCQGCGNVEELRCEKKTDGRSMRGGH